eukprot:scaffold196509_cov45-Prasinocladus_malaysianus.AAC.1
MRDHRALQLMMAPFSMDSGSVGRPSLFQRALSVSLQRTSNGVVPSVMGIARSKMSGSHFSFTRPSRKGMENGPT